jgi:CheY-like chemotaxis protein
LKKTTQFEVVPLPEVLAKARPLEDAHETAAPAPEPAKSPQMARHEMRRKLMRRVFVVDDERVIADTLSAILRARGFDARAFYDGASTLAACEVAPPDWIISDVVMPGMSGIDMGVRIRQTYPNCKILLFSGQAATAELLDRAQASGHEFEVLLKPVHPTELLAKLDTSRQQRVPHNEVATASLMSR